MAFPISFCFLQITRTGCFYLPTDPFCLLHKQTGYYSKHACKCFYLSLVFNLLNLSYQIFLYTYPLETFVAQVSGVTQFYFTRFPFPLAHSPALTLRRLMSYIYGAPILDVSRSHTMTLHSR